MVVIIRNTVICLLFVAVVGCGKHTIQTNSFMRLAPARVHVSSDPIAMAPQAVRDRTPLTSMPVQQGSGRRIALIDVDGLLVNANQSGLGSMGENPIDLFREKLDLVERQGNVCAVILRVNSVGGGVTASDIMRRELESFRERTGIPVVAILMDVATGGAYYLASAADQVIAHPTTLIGGFGVILNLYNLEDSMAQFNVVGQSIRSGKMIDIGSPERMLGADEEELLTAIADEYSARFKAQILRARKSLRDDADCFDGRVFTGVAASEYGLVDRLGYIDDAIAMARGFTGDPNATVIMLHRPQDTARTPYATTPNEPFEAISLPHIPGLSRSRLPTFLYIWQPDPALAP